MGPLPTLPFEIVRRIIRHRLALTLSIPTALSEDEEPSAEWDSLAGQSGRRAVARRLSEREDVQDAAMSLMRVCKAWKVCGDTQEQSR
jgi:hypothetical protein